MMRNVWFHRSCGLRREIFLNELGRGEGVGGSAIVHELSLNSLEADPRSRDQTSMESFCRLTSATLPSTP